MDLKGFVELDMGRHWIKVEGGLSFYIDDLRCPFKRSLLSKTTPSKGTCTKNADIYKMGLIQNFRVGSSSFWAMMESPVFSKKWVRLEFEKICMWSFLLCAFTISAFSNFIIIFKNLLASAVGERLLYRNDYMSYSYKVHLHFVLIVGKHSGQISRWTC